MSVRIVLLNGMIPTPTFETTVKAAKLSGTLTEMMGDDIPLPGDDIPLPGGDIPLPGDMVDKRSMELVLEWCEAHVTVPIPPEELLKAPVTSSDFTIGLHGFEYDVNFLVKLDNNSLFNLISTANYLAIGPLYDLCTRRIACLIKDKTPAQIREMFGPPKVPIEQVREENKKLFAG
jgi:hypothetical protein